MSAGVLPIEQRTPADQLRYCANILDPPEGADSPLDEADRPVIVSMVLRQIADRLWRP